MAEPYLSDNDTFNDLIMVGSFDKYLLSTCCVPGTVLSVGETAVEPDQRKILVLVQLLF